jgi:hypothetical protein
LCVRMQFKVRQCDRNYLSNVFVSQVFGGFKYEVQNLI